MYCCAQSRKSSTSRQQTSAEQKWFLWRDGAAQIWTHGHAKQQQGADLLQESQRNNPSVVVTEKRIDDSSLREDRPFDPQRMNMACREVLRSGNESHLGNAFSFLAQGEVSQVGDGALTTESKPWWYLQLQTATSQAKAEAIERQRRRVYAAAVVEDEQQRRIAEDLKNVVEENQERKRRREFAKRALAEEQYTRVREQQLAEARDNAERVRRRKWAEKAQNEEEKRRVEERLRCRHLKPYQQGQVASDPCRYPPQAAVQQYAFFLAGVRLWMQYYRSERGVQGGGVVVQALKDLYARECLKVATHKQHDMEYAMTEEIASRHPQANAIQKEYAVRALTESPSSPMLRMYASNTTMSPSERFVVNRMAHERVQRVDQFFRGSPAADSSILQGASARTPTKESDEALAEIMEERKRVQYSARRRNKTDQHSTSAAAASADTQEDDLSREAGGQVGSIKMIPSSVRGSSPRQGTGDLPEQFRPLPGFHAVNRIVA